MSASLWWVWMVLAAVFLIGEMFTAGFFLLWFGVGAAVGGLVTLLHGGAAIQLAAFVVVSVTGVLVSRRFADRVTDEQPSGVGADRFIGTECVVLEEIDNQANTGRVRLGGEEWRAESESGAPVSQGTRVAVTEVVGTRARVRIIEKGH